MPTEWDIVSGATPAAVASGKADADLGNVEAAAVSAKATEGYGYTPVSPDSLDAVEAAAAQKSDVILSVKAYDATGDGTTSDQVSVAAAVAAAYAAGAELYWPAGSYLTTANVANLHSVRHRGPGAIKRGSATFYPCPKQGQTNTLYVDASAADDTGDGLSTSQPIKALSRVATVLSNYGPQLASRWLVRLAAGTYGGVNFTRKFITLNDTGLLEIRGPTVSVAAGYSVAFILKSEAAVGAFTVGETITGSVSGATATVTSVGTDKLVATVVAGVPQVGETMTGGTSAASAEVLFLAAVPTARILKSADTGKESGLVFGWNQQAQLYDLKTEGFTGSGGSGVDARKYCDIRLNNVHDDGSYYGWNFQEFTAYTANGALLENNLVNGITELFHVQRNLQGATTWIKGASGSGFNSKEMCSGHMDNLAVDSAGEAGLEFHSYVTANVGGLQIVRCPVGVTLTDAELHVESGIVWGDGADACDRKYVLGHGASLLSRTGWNNDSLTYRPLSDPKTRFSDFATHTYTGTTASQNITLCELYANEHATQGQTVRVRVRGKRTTGSNGTVTLRLLVENVVCSTVVMPITATASATFEVEFEILCYQDGDFQRFFAKSWQEGVLSDAQSADRTETWTANDKTLVLQTIPGHASDSITINDIRVWA